jgi:ankyrin repeat protein
MAAATGNEPTLKLLLDKGVSPDFKNARTGRSLLHAAAFYDQTDTAKLLIQRRAKLDITDNLGFTPLHVAAIRGSMGVLELLLKHKADCNLGCAAPKPPRPLNERMPIGAALLRLEGSTPLHLAALFAQTNAIQCLLTWGASINAVNARGATALDLAAQLNPPPQFLINNGGLGLSLVTRNPSYNNPSVRQATASLLERAGAKHGEPPRRGEFRPGFN